MDSNSLKMSDDLFFELIELESKWRVNRPKYSEKEWLEIFPEAKMIIPDKITELEEELDRKIKQLKKMLKEIAKSECDEMARWFLREWLKHTQVLPIIEVETHISRLKRMLSLDSKGKAFESGLDIEAARQKPILEIIDFPVKRAGRIYSGLCPFHTERTPSFYIYPDSNRFVCFGCQKKGDVITYIMLINNLNFIEAVKWLQKG